jgi:hypothetical protein
MAGGILLFSVIVVNIAPAINNLGSIQVWSQLSCKYSADNYKNEKDKKVCSGSVNSDCHRTQDIKDYTVDRYKREKNRCERRQAMVGLEYAALNWNLVFGFICALLGFCLFFNLGDVGKIASFGGLGAGIVGFVLTFVYVIESGLVFTDKADQYYVNDYYQGPRIASDGSFLEWDNSKHAYTCKFYKKKNYDSVSLRFSDFGNKYLHYNKDLSFDPEKIKEEYGCSVQYLDEIDETGYGFSYPSTYLGCKNRDEQQASQTGSKITNDLTNKECDKLYYFESFSNNFYKVIYDRWLTTIILCCFIMIMDIGLALFGFLVNNGSKGTGL